MVGKTFSGSTGNDIVMGGADIDVIMGGAGNDIIRVVPAMTSSLVVMETTPSRVVRC
jgi:hypothetical protein